MWTPVEIYNLDYTSPNDQSLWKKIMQNLGGDFYFGKFSRRCKYELDLNLELL
jgi:hypothetical protein